MAGTPEVKAEMKKEDLPGAEKPKDPQIPKFDKEELLKVFDELLFSGEYKETVKIKNKLVVTFRTRSTEEVMDMTKELDKTSYNLITTIQQHRAFLSLAYSLVDYQGRNLSNLSKEEKIKFLNKLPLNIVDSISNELAKFDEKVSQACNEAEQNF